MVSKKGEIWKECKRLGLDKAMKLKYNMTTERLEGALNRFKHYEVQEEKKPETIPRPREYKHRPKQPRKVIPVEKVEPEPESEPATDPETENAIKIFEIVAEKYKVTNNTTWQLWWVECRKQLGVAADSPKIQNLMRKWIKKHYNLEV